MHVENFEHKGSPHHLGQSFFVARVEHGYYVEHILY